MQLSYRQILSDGLWHQNTGLVALLGLCPLLAISTSVVNSLALGLATIVTLTLSNLTVSLIRPLLRHEIRIPAYVLIIASIVTAVELIMQAWFHELHRSLGIFIPLIVTNCAIIGRAEAFASRHSPIPAALDGFATGAGFCLSLLLLGTAREVAGHGSLLRDAEFLLGDAGAGLQLTVIPFYDGFLLAILPAGAFIGLGCLIAARSWLAERMDRDGPSSRRRAADPGWVSERSERHQRGRAQSIPSSEAAFRRRREQGSETQL